MAVVTSNPDADLLIKIQTGQTTDGTPTYTTKTITQLNPACTDADAHAVGIAIGGLQVYPVGSIQKRLTVTLSEEGE